MVDDDLFHNDTALDEQFFAHISLVNLTLLNMINEIARIKKEREFMELMTTFSEEEANERFFRFRTFGYEANALYDVTRNSISRLMLNRDHQ
ncbi:hypothetical protein COOONC_01856 [Cooperia oncophora]